MKNIGIFIKDIGLLGGVQKVTNNLTWLFFENNLPIKCIVTYSNTKYTSYEYPKETKIYNINGVIEEISAIIAKENISNFIIQAEDLKLSDKVADKATINGCKVFIVLHNSPFYWIKKYYTKSQYLRNPRYILQLLKMKFYWRQLHLNIFKRWQEKYDLILLTDKCKHELSELQEQETEKDRNLLTIANPHDNNPTKNINEKQNWIVYAGRLSQDKRGLFMLNIWSQVEPDFPDWHFYILGAGTDFDKMQHYIKRHDLKRVFLKGKVDNVNEYLASSKICILLSKYEGLPTILIEASQNSNALLCTNSDGGVADIVKNGINGYTVNAHKKEIVSKLKTLMDNNGERALKLGEHSFSLVNHNFNNSDILNKWKTILQ